MLVQCTECTITAPSQYHQLQKGQSRACRVLVLVQFIETCQQQCIFQVFCSQFLQRWFISCMSALSCGLTHDAFLHLQPGYPFPRFSAFNWALCVPASCNASDVQVALSDTLQRHAEGTGFGFEVRVTDDMCQTEDDRLRLPESTIIVG